MSMTVKVAVMPSSLTLTVSPSSGMGSDGVRGEAACRCSHSDASSGTKPMRIVHLVNGKLTRVIR